MSDAKNETETKASAMPAADKPVERAFHPRRKATISAVAVVTVAAVCAGGFAAWRVHENRLDGQARTDCSQAAKTLKSSRATWEKLLKDAKTGAGTIQANQVKDAKTVDALRKAMDAKTPTGSASCTAGGRTDAEDAATAIRKAADAYDTDAETLRTAVKAVEASKLDKTVDDANTLYKETDGRVADDKTRASLLDAIKKRDADAIAKAVKAVGDSVKAKEKADAQAKAKAEAEAQAQAQAAAAAAAAQAQQSWSSGSGYTGNGYSTGGYSGNTWSGGSPTSTGGGNTSTPSTGSSGSSSSGGSNSGDGWKIDIGALEKNPGDQYNCKPGQFCPIG